MSEPDDDFDPNDVLKGFASRPARPAERSDFASDFDLSGFGSTGFSQTVELDGIGSGAAAQARSAALETVERVDDIAFNEAPRVVPRTADPRLLAAWQPGAWIAAIKRIGEGFTEIVQSEHGPVIETHAAQALFAVWPPQQLDRPLLGRWPRHVGLGAGELPALQGLMLAALPDDALLWVGDIDVDWALVAEIALHHETRLAPHEMDALRAFVDAERQQTFERINDAYRRPAPHLPIGRLDDGA